VVPVPGRDRDQISTFTGTGTKILFFTGTGTGLKFSAGPGHYFFIKNSVIIYHIFYFAWTKNLQNQSFLSAISEKFYSEP